MRTDGSPERTEVQIAVDGGAIIGDLSTTTNAVGAIAFAHGSGSSRHSHRNQQVAGALQQHGFATLLMDLLTEQEEAIDVHSRALRFDIGLLAERVMRSVDWLGDDTRTAGLPIGVFGASTGAAAALVAAAERPGVIASVVSRGGRPDLARDALPDVQAPTLLIVGGADRRVIGMNEQARLQMSAEVILEVIPGATHLFEEPGALEEVARLASEHFEHTLTR